ncbi:MAG: NAD-dependent epimerase/dehydratase family protein [Candidatus Liptonbacteria bacterium]|nr:NAD-dependent epimerase/dehydratase family protein [Candidatus Liptonbacteria bacterium]
MKILVTGGAGFIASHIVDDYVKAGHKVIVVDNLSTGFRKNLNPKAKFYKSDIRNFPEMEKIFKHEKPTMVNHHAAVSLVMSSIDNQILTYETNLIGTVNLLLTFGEYGSGSAGYRKKFIFASSGGTIYGQPKKIPVHESIALAPISPYGLSKFLGEETVKFYGKSFGFEYLIFRYPNVYGPRDISHVIPIFARLMKKGIKPTIFGDGSKARDYTYIEDIAQANILGLKKGVNEILNLGWGKKITDKKVFDTIKKEISFVEKIKEKGPVDTPRYASYRKGEIYQIALDSGRATKILGWKPKIKFEEGIGRTLETL